MTQAPLQSLALHLLRSFILTQTKKGRLTQLSVNSRLIVAQTKLFEETLCLTSISRITAAEGAVGIQIFADLELVTARPDRKVEN